MGPLHQSLVENVRGRVFNTTHNPLKRSALFVVAVLLLSSVHGWKSTTSSGYSVFGDSLNRDWLETSSVSLLVNGCIWSPASNTDDGECIERSSEDGLVYWYKMANCLRPQLAFSLYADDSSGSSASANCNSKTFKESFVTKYGVEQFLYYLSTYAKRQLSDGEIELDGEERQLGGGEGDKNNNNKNGNQKFQNTYAFCTYNNGYYYGLGCNSDGSFALLYYNDAYCLEPTGEVKDTLSSLNSQVETYDSCTGIGSYTGKNGYSLAYDLVLYSESCSNLDTTVCTDGNAQASRRDSTAKSSKFTVLDNSANTTWSTKLKYVIGGLFLLASFVMFTGILFTNRRRRRALLQRKFRQSKAHDERSRSKSKSRSKSRTRDGSGTRKSSRSKTRSKSRTKESSKEEAAGVLA